MERESIWSFLFGWIFDFSFKRFLTVTITKIVYVIGVLLSALWVLFSIILGSRLSVGLGILLLFLAPINFLLSVAFVRLLCESTIIVFRIAELVGEIARQGRKSDSSVSGG